MTQTVSLYCDAFCVQDNNKRELCEADTMAEDELVEGAFGVNKRQSHEAVSNTC